MANPICTDCLMSNESGERVAKLETKVDHIEAGVSDMAKSMRLLVENTAEIKYLRKEVDEVRADVKSNKAQINKWVGGITAVVAALGLFLTLQRLGII